jgi:mRNA interferase RelE/StbE
MWIEPLPTLWRTRVWVSLKKGDLAGVLVHKFQCLDRRFLLAYEFDPNTRLLLLVGTHENFYRDLKR